MDATSNAQWYVLRSKPNKEDALYKQVSLRGFEAYYPCQTYKPVDPRSRKTKPFFAGYMFVHIDLLRTGFTLFQWMPYSAGLVNFDGEPAVIPASVMHTLITGIESQTQAPLDARADFVPGGPLKVIRGPFAGYEAIFDLRLAGDERIRILLSLARGNWIPVELPVSHVEISYPL